MPRPATATAAGTEHPDPEHPSYDRDAIFDQDGPLDPLFMDEAVRTLMRALPIDPEEPKAWAQRRMHSALIALAALHPRDEIEVMLCVQGLSAYYAAAACWRIGMNLQSPNGDSTRHITTAASAARTFETMLRALERRQAKPLSVPVGRPAPRPWPVTDADGILGMWETRCRRGEHGAEMEPPGPSDPVMEWTSKDLEAADGFLEQQRIDEENAGLDIAHTEGIVPGGGMIMMADPTPEQANYIARRLTLMYRREHQENLRNGINKYPQIRGIRPGELIP